MPSSTLPNLTNLPTPQPTMLLYAALFPFGVTDDRKVTADALLQEITAAIADLSVQWGDGNGVATVSDAGKGKIRYNNAAGAFQASINGGAYVDIAAGGAFSLGGVQVATNATQAIGDNTLTPITFNTAVWDTNSFFSGGAPTRITFATAGRYQIDVQVSWDNPGAGAYIGQARLNGAGGANDFLSRNFINFNNGASPAVCQNFSFKFDAAAADYIEIEVYQNSGNPVNLSGAAGIQAAACRVWVTALFN